jgi:cytoskeletal protein CcmA (bactofilin family)
MKKIFYIFIVFLLLISFSSPFLSLAHAADVRGENTITISKDEKDLSDLYLFGNSITVEAPVRNDLVAAGGDIIVDNSTSGSIFAAGGTVRIKGDSGGSVRVAGGNIFIDGKVGRDLLVAGGNVTITKTATIAGDLLIAGGELTIQGNVEGKAVINGGKVRIDGVIGKQVEGNMGQLFLGPKAIIGGNLSYSSPEKATVDKDATIKGTQHYTRVEKPKEEAKQVGALFGSFSIYKLIADIILSVVLIFFLGKFIQTFIERIRSKPFRNFAWGFAFLFLTPLISLFLLVFLLPGVAAFIFYFLVIIFSVYLAKVFIGWLILCWWYSRRGNKYVLDWKSGVAGPIAFFIASLIPVLGWLFTAILYLITIGALIQEFAIIFRTQRIGASRK